MAKVMLLCGKICSGKTSYSKKLCNQNNAVLLSSDELISILFHPKENEYHDKIIAFVHQYLLSKSIEIVHTGTNCVLDWGFWTQLDREKTTNFYKQKGVEIEWYYLDIGNSNWERNIRKRNSDVLNNRTMDYFVDQGLLEKLDRMFEVPSNDDIDVWVDL